MRARITIMTFVLSLFMVLGCVTTQSHFYAVKIDSISGMKADKNRYVLLPGNKDTTVDDLQFKEFATYINCALTKKGFVPSDSPQEANVAIILFYGISDPQEYQHTYSVPIWGQTGVSSSRTTGTLNTYGNHGTYSGTTTYTPTYGIKGSTTRTKTYTKYIRFFVLDAVDLDEYRKSEKEVQLWKTTVTSSGSGGDLRRIFPVLVAASQEYFGENTGQEIDIRMSDKDKRVVEIKGIATTDKQ